MRAWDLTKIIALKTGKVGRWEVSPTLKFCLLLGVTFRS